MQSFQVVNGELRGMQETCVVHAIRTFLARRDVDANPQIVQMVIDTKPIDHWYYRSDSYVDQPYFLASLLIQPLIGDPSGGYPRHYGEGTFQPDEGIMRVANSENAEDFSV